MPEVKLVKNIFDWDHFCTYLSGPIDMCPDGGNVWRDEWVKGLIDIGFRGNQIFNPCRKPIEGSAFNLDNEQEIMVKLRKKKDYANLSRVVGEIAHIDLRLVDKSDLILVNIPLDSEGRRVYTYGTVHEIVVARQQKKPVFMVWEGGKQTCSGWLMWLIGHRNIFATFEEMSIHLQRISKGKTAYNAKDWLLINLDKNIKETEIESSES